MIVTSKDNIDFEIQTLDDFAAGASAERRYAASKTAAELDAHGDYRRCLCGASTVGAWTAGVHHNAHRCARVVTRPALRLIPGGRQ